MHIYARAFFAFCCQGLDLVQCIGMKKNLSILLVLLCILSSFGYVANAQVPRPEIVADSILAYTNAERYKTGLPLYISNSVLSRVAREKMYDLFAYEYFAHESLKGETVKDLASRAGYEYIVVGENLALGDFRSDKEVVHAWMNSPGHRKNILSETFTEIGIAAGKGLYEGHMRWIIVQSFGLPKSSCPEVDVELAEDLEELDRLLSVVEGVALQREKEAKRKEGTLEERKARIELYNISARLYNMYAERHRVLVEAYNESVGEYNECLKEVREKLALD